MIKSTSIYLSLKISLFKNVTLLLNDFTAQVVLVCSDLLKQKWKFIIAIWSPDIKFSLAIMGEIVQSVFWIETDINIQTHIQVSP